MRTTPRCSSIALAGLLFAAAWPASATDWPQFGFDTAHSGFNRAETGYSTATGNTILYHYALPAIAGTKSPGTVDGAPIYVAGVATQSGSKNVLFGLTNNGTFYALDADSTTLNILWSNHPAGAGNTTQGFGSGVIDPDLQYVYAYGFDGKVHKYQIGDGTEVMAGGWPEVSTLKPNVDKGAASLSIAKAKDGNTYLYSVTDGYIGDGGDYQGHLTAINLATGAQKVFNSLCSDLTFHFVENGVTSGNSRTDCASAQNGIWGRPGAVYDAGTDLVFITTGNGPFNVNPASTIYNWGDSVLALHPDGSGGVAIGMPVDSYTPTTFASLQSHDADLGSESIAIVPPPTGPAAAYMSSAVQTGKDGCVRLIKLADLSGHGAPAHTGGELQALDFPGGSNCATGMDGPELRSHPAVWVNPDDGSSWVYVASIGNGFAAYEITANGAGTPSMAQKWTSANGGTSPVVAGRTVYFQSGTHLRAVDATTGTSVISATSTWLTTATGGVHWQSPIVVNGRVYLFDNANPSNLWVYQLDGGFKSGFD